MARLLRVVLNPPLLVYTAMRTLFGPLVALRELCENLAGLRRHDFVLATWTLPGSSKAVADGRPKVVFVGPTIGEYRMMRTVGEALRARRPDVRLVYCLKDPVSVEAARRSEQESSVGYRPVDYLPIVARWLGRIEPSVIVFTEGLRFPTLAWGGHLYGAAIVGMNAVYPRRDKPRHHALAFYYRWLVRPFHMILFVRESARENAASWVASESDLRVVGNLKGILAPPPLLGATVASLATWLGEGAPLLIAGSTDPTDESMVLDAFLSTLEHTPCRLLVAPRQTGRTSSLVSEAKARGLRVACRTHSTASDSEAEVFVLDTLGELAAAYSLGCAAYVGGFLKGDGHNVLEPLASRIPIAYGPRRGAFEEAQTMCEEAGVGTRVSTSDELARHWRAVLDDVEMRDRVRDASQCLLDARREALDRTVDALVGLLPASRNA